jgi:hypothetical protein
MSGVPLGETSVSMGGLFRCCIASLSTWAAEQPKDATVAEGTVVPCLHCDCTVILEGQRWRWNYADEPASTLRTTGGNDG